MVIEISEFYKEKGYIKGYLITNKESRRIVILYKNNKTTKTISYARYLYTSFYKTDLSKDIDVDHINGNKLDDRIENLQSISKKYNIQKDHKKKECVLLTCPICGIEFLFEKRNLSTHPNPCCSRKCGGIKSHGELKIVRCKVCGEIIENANGREYCSDKCRKQAKIKLHNPKNYPTLSEINEQYEILGSWEKVAEYYHLTRKIIQGIRKRG